jgi:hypothetical protein
MLMGARDLLATQYHRRRTQISDLVLVAWKAGVKALRLIPNRLLSLILRRVGSEIGQDLPSVWRPQTRASVPTSFG